MKIEEHLDHWENPAMCIDPDNCPVVYASIMHEAEKGIQPQTPFFQPSRLEYLKKHWNTTDHDPFLCPDCTEYLETIPEGFNADLEAQR